MPNKKIKESVLDRQEVDPRLLNPKEYISSIEASGNPKKEHIMNKYRASSIEYIIENNPPPKIYTSEIKNTTTTTTTTAKNTNNNNNSLSPPTTKPRSKSCPPVKELPKIGNCNHCKKRIPTELLQPCARCGDCDYCSEDCQFSNWSVHKKRCSSLNMVIKMKRNYSF